MRNNLNRQARVSTMNGQRHFSEDILHARDHNRNQDRRQSAGYKPGVRIIHGIAYTEEEQFKLVSRETIQSTAIAICKDQKINPNLSMMKHVRKSEYTLPDANELISGIVMFSKHPQ